METAGASSPAVTKIPGEPAILITGLPNPSSKNRESKSQSVSKPESEFRSEPDPCFGEWLEGRKVRKQFGDLYYDGKVVSYDKDENWYKVEYEDGDLEDLDWYELETILVPLDISIPLKDLALNLGKWDDNYNINSASKSGLKRGRMRRGNSVTTLESGINDLALVPVKMEITEIEEESLLVDKSSKKGRKPKSNNGNKDEMQLVTFKDGEKSGEASRRKREGKRREPMNTAQAERQKRKEQQTQR